MTERVNNHHMMFEKRLYRRDRVMNRLREHPGLILPTYITDHQALHRAVWRPNFNLHTPTIPMPARESADYFLDNVAEYDRGQDYFHTVDQAIEFFTFSGDEPTAEHLDLQRYFLGQTASKDIGCNRVA
jgi:hypothetical protein